MHSAVYAAASCLSFTLRYSIEAAEWTKLVFGTEATVGVGYLTLSCYAIRVSPEIRVLPSKILS